MLVNIDLNKIPSYIHYNILEKGVYEVGLNFNHIINSCSDFKIINEYHNCKYGVCDNYKQILECHVDDIYSIDNHNKQFIVCVTPITKNEQPPEGGWRWHKWGKYIGKYETTCEYLYDEENIDMIYVYNIYEVEKK
jgi:hypothetical protein